MRKKTKVIEIGDIKIGGNNPIAVQSMTNTDTSDVESTIKQIINLEKAGCEIIRSTVNNIQSSKALKKIKDNINIPIVADIHFDYKLAISAIENGADKIRINTGNIGTADRVKKIVDCAKSHKIPIRIGVNSGSIEKEILKTMGNTPQAMAQSAKKYVQILEDMNFTDIVVSLKASDVIKTIKACRLFSEISSYPQHIGITEAGTLEQGLIKSGIGIGSLLLEGIGDTIRVSLSCSPVIQVQAAWNILNACDIRKRGVEIISCPTCGRTCIDVESLAKLVKCDFKHVSRHITIAVMGCVVNGPGEAREADVGIAGGIDYSVIFEGGEIIAKIKNEDAMDILRKVINKHIN